MEMFSRAAYAISVLYLIYRSLFGCHLTVFCSYLAAEILKISSDLTFHAFLLRTYLVSYFALGSAAWILLQNVSQNEPSTCFRAVLLNTIENCFLCRSCLNRCLSTSNVAHWKYKLVIIRIFWKIKYLVIQFSACDFDSVKSGLTKHILLVWMEY